MHQPLAEHGDASQPEDLEHFDRLLEQSVEVPAELHAVFRHSEIAGAGEDNFNDLGRHFTRDNSNRVATNEELIARVNHYSYSAPTSSKIGWMIASAVSCGGYAANKTKTVPAGYFGHYVSAGRHKLMPAGRHTLKSTRAVWLDDEPVDDPGNLVRFFGIKTLIVVPENHVAGAFRVGGRGSARGVGRPTLRELAEPERSDSGIEPRGEETADGEFVLLGQGRHVLDSSCYRNVVIEKLETDRVRMGPVTVLYIKEGMLGGAYERNTGTFRILQPGPPYLLHEKDFEGIELVPRTLKPFKVGPINFVTVKEGEMAGAYHKSTGLYQLLSPGHMYQLHSKDYEQIQLRQRSNLFQLGPYTFITVQKGHLAGAYKKKGGEFVLLPAGHSYQLNEDEFEAPSMVKRDRHVVRCGPLTFLTLQEGVLTGAYRTQDGRFEEFAMSKDGCDFVLHERDYHGLTVVDKYSSEVQDFGPNKIVTIPEGECGVFEREGAIEIKEPGFYKVSAEYRIRDNIPLQIHSEQFEKLEFVTKDSVRMRTSFVVVWRVEDPVMVAKWPGSLDELKDCCRSKAQSGLVMLLRSFSRAELMPTRQDVFMGKGGVKSADDEEEAAEEAMRRAAETSRELQRSTEQCCLELLNNASADGGWGFSVVSVKIDHLQLADEKIIADMQLIAQSELAAKRKQMEGHLAVVSANVDREAAIQKARAAAEVQQTKAESDAMVQLANARAENEIALMQATSAAQAQAEAKKIDLDMQREFAESQVAIQETQIRAKQREAEAEASAVIAMADANYQRGCKEQEVASKMPPQELELKRLELVVQGLMHYGQAAWRYPDEMQAFMEQLKPYLRLAPGVTACQMHDAAKGGAPGGAR